MSPLEMLLKMGKRDGLVKSEKFVFVPEVMSLGGQVCSEMH